MRRGGARCGASSLMRPPHGCCGRNLLLSQTAASRPGLGPASAPALRPAAPRPRRGRGGGCEAAAAVLVAVVVVLWWQWL